MTEKKKLNHISKRLWENVIQSLLKVKGGGGEVGSPYLGWKCMLYCSPKNVSNHQCHSTVSVHDFGVL